MGISPQEWWPLYFVSDVYDARDRRADLAQQLITYFTSADGFFWVEQARGVSDCVLLGSCGAARGVDRRLVWWFPCSAVA